VLLQSAFLALALVTVGRAQDSAANPVNTQRALPAGEQEQLPGSVNAGSRKLSIGPGDELDVSVYGVPDLSQAIYRF